VFTWQSTATLQQETLVTVELFPKGAHTELVLVHELLPDEHSAAQHNHGWQSILEKFSVSVSNKQGISPTSKS
jgi:hypothetical protein